MNRIKLNLRLNNKWVNKMKKRFGKYKQLSELVN